MQDMSHSTQTGYNTLENIYKPLVFKELRKIWENDDPSLPWKNGDYNESNTLLLDDSPYKALLNPVWYLSYYIYYSCLSSLLAWLILYTNWVSWLLCSCILQSFRIRTITRIQMIILWVRFSILLISYGNPSPDLSITSHWFKRVYSEHWIFRVVRFLKLWFDGWKCLVILLLFEYKTWHEIYWLHILLLVVDESWINKLMKSLGRPWRWSSSLFRRIVVIRECAKICRAASIWSKCYKWNKLVLGLLLGCSSDHVTTIAWRYNTQFHTYVELAPWV